MRKPDALSSARVSVRCARARAARARASRPTVPLVLDADALNLDRRRRRARRGRRARNAPTVITPHPAEAARLLGIDDGRHPGRPARRRAALRRNSTPRRRSKARAACSRFPTGRGQSMPAATPASPRAGTGDVLAGMLGALLAQGDRLEDALKLAVCLHGAAADALVAGGLGPLGLTASRTRAGGARAAQLGAESLRCATAAVSSSRSSCATRGRDAPVPRP